MAMARSVVAVLMAALLVAFTNAASSGTQSQSSSRPAASPDNEGAKPPTSATPAPAPAAPTKIPPPSHGNNAPEPTPASKTSPSSSKTEAAPKTSLESPPSPTLPTSEVVPPTTASAPGPSSEGVVMNKINVAGSVALGVVAAVLVIMVKFIHPSMFKFLRRFESKLDKLRRRQHKAKILDYEHCLRMVEEFTQLQPS
ncbi:hypothetical protein ACLB2K_020389 [Fragaria x ananassa]